MTLVVDASVAIKWFIEEDGWRAAVDLLDSNETFAAPDFIKIELTNVGWKKVRRGEADTAQIEAMINTIDGFFSSLALSNPLLPDAYRIATELDHPIYDCLYLACARSIGARLVTADQRLRNKCQSPTWRDVVSLLPAG